MKKYLIILMGGLLFTCSGSGDDGNTGGTTVNSPPTVPLQIYPTNNLLCIDAQIEFKWNSSEDKENDAITYEVQVATNQAFTSGVNTKTISQTTSIFALEKGVAYYWRVRTKDSKGDFSDYSSIYKFYTEGEGITNHLPFTPTLVKPALNELVASNSAILEWTASDVDNDQLTFDVYFGDTNLPSVLAEGITNFSYEVSLNSATTYYWKIVVKDLHGGQAIGQLWTFNTE
jgi:hypothetical protein